MLASCQLKAADGTAAAAVAAVPGRTLPPVDVDDNISSFTDLPALDDLVGGVSGGDHDSRRHRTFRVRVRKQWTDEPPDERRSRLSLILCLADHVPTAERGVRAWRRCGG